MESRFTVKDAVFVVLFVVVIAAVGWAAFQFGYQEKRLNDVRGQLQSMEATQKQQLQVLTDIRTALKSGVKMAGVETQPNGVAKTGTVREKRADGSIRVTATEIPQSPRRPDLQADYATGDWLIQNVGMEPDTIAPFVKNDMGASLVRVPVLEGLASLNPETLEYEPSLSDWYEISADGLKFRFHLRAGVCFSDGKPVRPEDVIFSYNTVMNPDVDAAAERSFYERVKACRKVDDRTVEFELEEPYFLALSITGGLPVIPEHVYKFEKGEEHNRRTEVLVGTGPYVLERWDRGQKITMARNQKYWGDRPTYDKIVYKFIGNPQAQLQSFLNGDLDYMGEPIAPDPEQYIQYSQDPEFTKKFTAYKYSRVLGGMYMYLGYNCDKPMFKDRETRTALTMLIDRKGIIDKMLHGFGQEMTGPFKPRSKQNDETVKPIPYDVEGAKRILAAARWKAGSDGVLERDGVKFQFDLTFRTGVPIRERIATYVQQQFQQAGIRVRLTPYESSVLLERIQERQFDAGIMGWGGGGVEMDPKQIWHSGSVENRGSNHVAFRNKEADRLIEEGRKTLDDEKRMEIWHKFQRIVYEEQPYTWLFTDQDSAFINGRFKNTEPYPTGLLELDWYVPAAQQKYR